MKILNLMNPEKSDIKYVITHFPDGEVHFSFCDPIIDIVKEEVNVKCRITSAEDLFIILQVGDILDRFHVVWNLWISYLMSMRMDRLMDYGRPLSLKVVCDMLRSMKYRKIGILEAHSDKTRLFLTDHRFIQMPFHFSKYIPVPDKCCIIYPDAGALDRYSSSFGYYGNIVFNKVRDLNTGKIISFDIAKEHNRFNSNTFVFIDDLCDAGGTFLGELATLKEKYPEGNFHIIVCHMVNEKGIDNLCNNFDSVTISNSYKDWDRQDRDCLKVVKIWE